MVQGLAGKVASPAGVLEAVCDMVVNADISAL